MGMPSSQAYMEPPAFVQVSCRPCDCGCRGMCSANVVAGSCECVPCDVLSFIRTCHVACTPPDPHDASIPQSTPVPPILL